MKKVKQISFGSYHTAAVFTDGSVACWGHNAFDAGADGQCDVPTGIGPVQQIVAGGFHTVALLEDGSVACWGRNDDGQCDVSEFHDTVVSVAAGEDYTVAVLEDGSLAYWGAYPRDIASNRIFRPLLR